MRTDTETRAALPPLERVERAAIITADDEFRREDAAMTYSLTVRALTAALLAIGGVATPRAADLNDYPTSARADYVFACMKTNGETRHALDQCSCSIDVIASLLPYERYVAAETVMSMAQVPGERASVFRTPAPARAALNDLRQAQAEAEVRCF
jgi:hypothetical protein